MILSSNNSNLFYVATGKLPYSSTWRLQVTNNDCIMAPVVHFHTMILFHMTPTSDVVHRRLPAWATLTPTETATSLDPLSCPCLRIKTSIVSPWMPFKFVFFRPLIIFPRRGFLEGFFRGHVGHMS